MTFYNIVYGIAFFAAIRQLFIAIAAQDLTGICLAAALALLVFNDTVYTSNFIEDRDDDRRANYSLGMKLIDLAGFVLLLVATSFLSPDDSVFGKSANIGWMAAWPLRACFWFALFAYAILANIWQKLALANIAGGDDRGISFPTKLLPWLMLVAGLIGLPQNADIDRVVSAVMLLLVLGYLAYIMWYAERDR